MSGIDVLNPLQDLDQQTSAQDPAASLREAALRTLKSKRRKLNSHPTDLLSSFPERSGASSSANIQLDYGQAETSGGSLSAPSAAAAPPTQDSAAMDVDEEGQAKEEGEISDSETAPATPFQSPSKDLPTIPSPTFHPPEKTAPPRRAVASPVAPPLKPSAILIKTESLPVTITDSLSSSAMDSTSDYDRLPFDPAFGFVRPGLAMNQAQYDTVKELILEILGWGVPPDYLVKCGISREVVYYTFLDLKLKLPENVDTSDLPPLEELVARASAFMSRRTASPAIQHTARPQPTSHNRLQSPAPIDVPRTTLSPSAQPFVPVATGNNAKPDLLDMEQQRRQQLRARKVAQASRKAKHATSPDSTPQMHPEAAVFSQAEQSLSALPHVAVDDFLNSIEPAKVISREGSRAPVSRVGSLDEMEVDGPPGLSIASAPFPASAQAGGDLARFSTQQDIAILTTTGPTISTHAHRFSPTALQRTDTVASGSSSSSGSTTPPVGAPHIANPRRGAKRPVAADFADMDPGPSRAVNGHNGIPVHNHHHHHPHPHHHGHGKKKPAMFAAVSTKHRRMVIDLTDSEDDEDGADSGSKLRAGSHQPSQASVAPPPNAQNQLVEREREIQALKDRIARKQLEVRLKREAALASGRGTPLSGDITTVSSTVVTVKVEEEDTGAASSLSSEPE
ncbi:hypothetical protein EIP91_005799 [Steccherinum ochraceum]|uniref:Uncharacterized protein n=1 Tax=Steccherinum ochraceum TaxID=92696 RepID=A0A4R0R9H5_9APHY|nr:hypothetical protein EIP91_005799 [Steccherinum ochraceum]